MTRRWRIAVVVPALAAAGLAARFGLPGAAGDLLGGVAYTALAYALLAIARPQLARRTVAAWAFGWSAVIELLQLSGVAAELVAAWSPLRLIVGSSFVPTDFLAYAAGALLAAAADARWSGER